MKFSFYSDAVGALAVDLLSVGVFEDQLSEAPLFVQLDRLLEGQLTKITAEESFAGKDEQSLIVHTLGRLPAARVLVVGLGRRPDFQLPDSRRYAASVVLSAIKMGAHTIAMGLPPVDGAACERAVQFLAEGALLGRYRFDRYLSKEEDSNKDKLERVQLLVATDQVNPCHLAIGRAELVARAVTTARDLVNEPAARLPPRELAEFAQTLARDRGLECKILGPKECEKQRMRLFLAVAQGSAEEPRFIHLTYRPKGKEKPKRRVVLVGKGITFDSGGLSLKPSASMVDMKTDMAGAAVALTVIGALPSLALNSEIHVVVAAAENMISGSAYKIGDIFTGLGGKSVEIVNTDAEGRLTLADALAYAVKLAPDEIIDIATLTGACVVALGPHIAGVMGNDRAFVERFLAAARKVGEEFWPLPLPERLKDQLKSPVADLKNSGERWGAALVAGLFLQEFVGQTPWIHLDVAGPASVEKEWGHVRKGGTGFGVAALLEYLCSRDDLPST
jgi:leucyl aminopeptidase